MCLYHGTESLKPGFHYPSWRLELTARVDGWPVSITRDGPLTRLVETGLNSPQLNSLKVFFGRLRYIRQHITKRPLYTQASWSWSSCSRCRLFHNSINDKLNGAEDEDPHTFGDKTHVFSWQCWTDAPSTPLLTYSALIMGYNLDRNYLDTNRKVLALCYHCYVPELAYF